MTDRDSSDFADPLAADDGVVAPTLQSPYLPADGTVRESALLLNVLVVHRTLGLYPTNKQMIGVQFGVLLSLFIKRLFQSTQEHDKTR